MAFWLLNDGIEQYVRKLPHPRKCLPKIQLYQTVDKSRLRIRLNKTIKKESSAKMRTFQEN